MKSISAPLDPVNVRAPGQLDPQNPPRPDTLMAGTARATSSHDGSQGWALSAQSSTAPSKSAVVFATASLPRPR